MPTLAPPDASGNPALLLPGERAWAVAIEQLGAPYVTGGVGPYASGFDCSGLMYYCYYLAADSPHINIGRDTVTQWNNSTTLDRIYDAQQAQAQGLTPIDESQLVVGDLIMYAQNGNSDSNAHVMMYGGSSTCIEAPHSGDVVKYTSLVLGNLSSTLPFLGVKRVKNSGTATTAGNTTGSSSGTAAVGSGNQTITGQVWKDQVNQNASALASLKDPRSNLPFSALFQGQSVPGGGGGSLRTSVGGTPFMPATQLVRGGMVELVAKQFKCYFMMNPQQITTDAGISTDSTSPLEMDPTQIQNGGNWVSNQTYSFTIYFNRMYEVWHGGTPGPSDIGCRWDIRALERLMGIFDSVTTGVNSVGVGRYGAGGWQAMTMPVQVVFGGSNALQFQGVISTYDSTYTIFDKNMIPVEAFADVTVMRIYQPQLSSAPLVSGLITTTGQVGSQTLASVVASGATGTTGLFTK